MATTTLLWQVLAVAVAFAHAQFDLPYPLQLVPGVPSAVSPQLYGPEPKAVSLIRGTTSKQGGEGQHQAPAEEEATQFHSQDLQGRSLFGYMMADQARIEARAPDGFVRGSYSYLDPSGRAIKVQYWDEGQGFHAAGNHLPATYPGLPQPVRDTPEVEAARRQHMQAYQQVLRRQLELLYQQQVQDQQQQGYQPPSDSSEEVVVESDPAAPPTDYAEDEPGHRYPSLPLVAALYDPSHVHDVGRDAVIVDSAAGRQGQQGSTMDDHQDSSDSSKTSTDNGEVLGHGANSGQRFIIVYADSTTGDNTIDENDDEKPSTKHVRSAHQNSSTSDDAAHQNHTKTATRKARRGRVTIYDYINERDPERMARNFPESYLIQEIFNSTVSGTHTDDDTDDLQRAAEREFQFLHKIGGAKSRGRSMLAADVVTSDSGSRRRTFYKAGMVLPDLSYPTRHSGETQTSASRSGADFHGGEPVLHRGYVSYNGSRGTYRPHFTYVEDGASDATRQGSPSPSQRSDSHPSVSTEGEISHNYSVASVSSDSQGTPHPVYYPEHTDSYLNHSEVAGHDVYDEAGRSNIHRDQSSLPGASPVTQLQEGNLGDYDMRDMQDPYNHQELPLDTYFRPREHSRSRYELHPLYYQGSNFPVVNETQVTSDSSFKGTGSDGVGRQYQLFDDSSAASSQFGAQVASRGRSNEMALSRNFSREGRRPIVVGDVVYSPPHSKYGALFVKVDSDDDGSRDHRGVSRISSQIVAQPHVSGGYYSMGSSAQRDHQVGHPSGVTNVGGYPPVAMQYLQDIARRADTPIYRQSGTKEAVVLNNLIARSASSKARSLEVPAAADGEGGKVEDPEGRTGASKEELVAKAVVAGSSKDDHAAAGTTEVGRSAHVDQRSVVSLKDGQAESYSAMYIYPDRQAKAASPKASAMPQPQVDGGFFYSFHHPVIPVAVKVAGDAADAAADADAKAPPRGLSVSQRASLYDAVPVAAVHDAQVPPYLRGAVTDHQTKPIFIHYDPAEAARAS